VSLQQFLSGCAALACLAPALGHAEQRSGLSAAQIFEIATKAQAAGDVAGAEAIYRTLEHDPHLDIRCEARFRHAQLLETRKHNAQAAVLLRAILDEQPGAQRVRLELAKLLALMGHENEARRELRAAQAGGLPPQIAQVVDQFQAALRAYKPLGGSFELGLAPSSNINRASNGTTINSVLGPLDLSRDARAETGLGLNVSGQAFVQIPVSTTAKLTARVSTANQFYRQREFDDDTFAGEIGAEVTLGRSRVRATVGESDRLYGTTPYSLATNFSLDWQRALGRKAQLDVESDASIARYQQNRLQNGTSYTESISYERAITPRFGGRITVSGQRTNADDPGYATTSGGGTVLVYREVGKTSLFASVGVNHLWADAPLLFFGARRDDWLTRASAGATFRYIKVAGFSPVLRVSYERNTSPLQLYDYRRFGGEVAITRAF